MGKNDFICVLYLLSYSIEIKNKAQRSKAAVSGYVMC